MKSRFLLLITLLLAALFATGCAAAATPAAAPTTAASVPTVAAEATDVPSAEPTAVSDTTTDTPASDDTAATGAFPVTIEHKYGSTEITDKPERVVVVGLVEQDALLAMGVVPVATTEWFGEQPGAIFPWATDKLGDAELPVVLGSEIDFEQIAALQPDVIIGLYSGLTEEQYNLLSQIAPTVAQPADYVDYGVPWQDVTITVGKILGQEAQATQLVAELEANLEAARTDHPEFEGKTMSLVSTWGDGSYWAYGPEDPRVRFMTNLGFVLAPGLDELTQDGGEFGVSVSDERMDLVDNDLVIWFTENAEETDALKADPVYASLEVAKGDHQVFLQPDNVVYNAYNFNTVLSLQYTLDELIPQISTALNHDSAAVIQ